MDKFSIELLQAVSDWQRGGSAKQNKRRGERLKELSKDLPQNFKACGLCCFRQIALPQGGVWKLIGENLLPEKISSWTTDLAMSKLFKGGVPPEGQGYQGVILCLRPPPDSVIVNLGALYADPEFREALVRNMARIEGYHDGAGRYGNEQSEVVLEVSSVTQEEVYSLGGHSSAFELLVAQAAAGPYGRPATDEELDRFMLKAESMRSQAGPKWLSFEATQRVLQRIKPR